MLLLPGDRILAGCFGNTQSSLKNPLGGGDTSHISEGRGRDANPFYFAAHSCSSDWKRFTTLSSVPLPPWEQEFLMEPVPYDCMDN